MSERVQKAFLKIDATVNDAVLNQWLLEDNDKKLAALLTIRKKLESTSTDKAHYFETAKNSYKMKIMTVNGRHLSLSGISCKQNQMNVGK